MKRKIYQFLDYVENGWFDDNASMSHVIISQLAFFAGFVMLCAIAWGWMLIIF